MLLTSRATLACRSVGAKSVVVVALAVADGDRAVPSSSVATARSRATSTAAPARLTPRRAVGGGLARGRPLFSWLIHLRIPRRTSDWTADTQGSAGTLG